MDGTTAAVLSEYDFIVVIDKSGSMGEKDMPGNCSRWKYMEETAVAFCRDIEELDSDGIGVVLFSGTSIIKEDEVTVSRIKDVFASNRPSGGTPLAEALEAALSLAGKSDKKDFITVFTDGIPDDKTKVVNVIKKQANSQETDDACTILFVQVGHDVQAASYLKSLDDDIKGAKFDIVDVKTIDEAEKFPTVAELIVAAIND